MNVILTGSQKREIIQYHNKRVEGFRKRLSDYENALLFNHRRYEFHLHVTIDDGGLWHSNLLANNTVLNVELTDGLYLKQIDQVDNGYIYTYTHTEWSKF